MIGLLTLVPIAALYFTMHIVFVHRYYKTGYKANLYMSATVFFLALAAVFGSIMDIAGSLNNSSSTVLFTRLSVTSGILGCVFLNMSAIAMTKPVEKMHGIWISLSSYLSIIFVFWAFNPVLESFGGVTKMMIVSTYKAPYGPPIVEIILALMAVIAVYPTYLFFRVAKDTKDRAIKIKSLLIGIGIFIATTAYALEITKAISQEYIDCRPFILVGTCIIFFGYLMPRQIERLLVGRAPLSEELVRSFVEEFFLPPVTAIAQTQQHAFSKTLGLNHRQMTGRKILLEFDPASSYEKAVQDFAAEALANAELTVVFTRIGSAIHSSMREQKAVKFFCLTQQVSVPKGLSENEMLLPSKDTSLMLDAFDKTLKAHPEGNINVVFDSLSDLVLTIGFEETYRFMRYAIEVLTSPRNTVVFLLNQAAHDPKVASSLRGLFSDQVSLGKKEMQAVKLSELEVSEIKA